MISIVIPIYNVEKYLEECLLSIKNQTYEDFEVIMVDDESTDSSTDIAESFVKMDSRFTLVKQKNAGAAIARNTGLEMIKGEYFCMFDSDDCIHPQFLEIAYKLAVTYDANLVQVDCKTVAENFKYDVNSYKSIKIEEIEVHKFNTIDAMYALDRDNQSLSSDIRLSSTVVWTKLYKTDVYKKFRFIDTRVHNDQMVAHRIMQLSDNKMLIAKINLYYYRMSDSSIIRVGWSKKRLVILDCYKDRLLCAKEIGDKKLINFVYYRYLVCMFRNYYMVSNNLVGNEKKRSQKYIINEIKKVKKDKDLSLPLLKDILFSMFVIIPMPFVWMFRFRNFIKKK